ncbi:hypothetical protein O181_093379 [Austropuccinia psidii MF-1]|uniref:Uncharacterized protein n=1 Tax=Austropuccinia psidii MF-1 TaxID=1389203 RepID=A0A9Q3J136_9BASI|nr:hypothetical protein [Austropuccinia psidii MF-1]
MNFKLTKLTESSTSVPPPPVLCGYVLFSRFSSPSMASSGNFDPSQTYDSYKAFEVHDPACTECLARGGIYGGGNMGLLGKSSQLLRHLLLMEIQGIPIVSNLNTLIEIGTDILDVVTGSRQRDVARWTNVGGTIPIGGRPIYSSSEVPISRINTEEVVKRIKRISDSPTDPHAEGSDEFDGEEAVVVPHSVGHQSSTSSS